MLFHFIQSRLDNSSNPFSKQDEYKNFILLVNFRVKKCFHVRCRPEKYDKVFSLPQSAVCLRQKRLTGLAIWLAERCMVKIFSPAEVLSCNASWSVINSAEVTYVLFLNSSATSNSLHVVPTLGAYRFSVSSRDKLCK